MTPSIEDLKALCKDGAALSFGRQHFLQMIKKLHGPVVVLKRLCIGINLAFMLGSQERIEQFFSRIPRASIMIGKNPIILLQDIRMGKFFNVLGGAEMISRFLSAEEAIVSSIANERRFEKILHTQFGNSTAFLDELRALEGNKVLSQCLGIA